MEKIKVLGNCCLVFLTIVAVIVSCAFGYYHFFIKDETLGVNYIGNQVGVDIENIVKAGDLTEEEINQYEDRYFLNVSYYSNNKKNGIELQELRLDYFTDYTLTSDRYRSSGMQYVGNYQGTPFNTYDGSKSVRISNPFKRDNHVYYGRDDESVNKANEYVDNAFTYYDSANGISFNGVTNSNGSIATEFKRSTDFIVKIGGRAFSVSLDKYYDQDIGNVRNLLGIGWKVGDKFNRYYYTYGSLFQTCMQAVRTNSAGYGDYYITVDLSNFFSIKEYDMDSGKFKVDNVTDVIKTYSVLKFHYDENGCVNANQSMFKQIHGDKTYGLEEEIDTTYWQERVNYTLSAQTKYYGKEVFEYRYSDIYNGYFVSLSMDVKELFAEMPRTKVCVEFDLNSQILIDKNINIVGIDYNGFEDFEIDTLTITGETQTFYILEKGLHDTQLQTLKRNNGIVLDFGNNSINSDYVEVVL